MNYALIETLLFHDPNHEFTNVVKFLGEVRTNDTLAMQHFLKIKKNVASLADASAEVKDSLETLLYASDRVESFLQDNTRDGFNQRDAVIFIYYMLHKYVELKEEIQNFREDEL